MSVQANLLIFDCDGVLVDSEPLACRAVYSLLKTHGFKEDEQSFYKKIFGLGDEAVFKMATQDYGLPLEKESFFKTLDEHMSSLFLKYLKPIPGIEDCLRNLPWNTCVASNSPKNRLVANLDRTGLSSFLKPENIYSAEQVSRPKPAPDLYRYVADQKNVSPNQCLVIEDSLPGTRAALDAGMAVIGFCCGSHIPDDHAKNLLDLGASDIAFTSHELKHKIKNWNAEHHQKQAS
tara:strand:- start:1055 stop:1756 length:702 start_codon:yes stop_codon:yes gene_type:complete